MGRSASLVEQAVAKGTKAQAAFTITPGLVQTTFTVPIYSTGSNPYAK